MPATRHVCSREVCLARQPRKHAPSSKRLRIGVLGLLSTLLAAGCAGTPTAGLQPEYPPVRTGFFALWSDYVEVDSLRPTFRWQSFPRRQDLAADKSEMLKSVDDVTYELRIWDADPSGVGELVYAREGIAVPEYRLEEALVPATEYQWSVRAHFRIDGRPATIGWGLAGLLLQAETVPNPSCFRFKTPEEDGPTAER